MIAVAFLIAWLAIYAIGFYLYDRYITSTDESPDAVLWPMIFLLFIGLVVGEFVEDKLKRAWRHIRN